MIQTEAIAIRKTIPELVAQWDLARHELEQGLALIKLAEERLRCFTGPGSSYDLVAFRHDEHTLEIGRKIPRMKAAAWRYLVGRAEIKKLASVRRAKEIDDMLSKPELLPEVTVDNIMAWVESLGGLATTFLEEAALEVFEWLRPARQHYKTNDAFKVGKRVIITWAVEPKYGGGLRVRYDSEDRIRALDNIFHLLDGKGLSKTYGGDLADAVNLGTTGETTFFKFRAFRNGNLHVEFKRPDLVLKLNSIGGKGLPQGKEEAA